MKPVSFFYRNHRGEIKKRTIIPDGIEFVSAVNTHWNNQPGWFISGIEAGKGRRSFALAQIITDHRNVITPQFFKLELKD